MTNGVNCYLLKNRLITDNVREERNCRWESLWVGGVAEGHCSDFIIDHWLLYGMIIDFILLKLDFKNSF